MAKTIAVIGALDTKGEEFAFVKGEILRRGHQALMIDTGVMADPPFPPDITAEQVAAAAGTTLTFLRQQADRGTAIEAMTQGIAILVKELYEQNRLDAVLAMGGSAGTVIGTAAMRVLPVGVPKLMVSTLASGDVGPYVGAKDVVMFPSLVDVAGVNRISAQVFARAVGAIIGMVETEVPVLATRPLIAASMFGNTTQLVDACRRRLEAEGYEVLVFHATGTGGRIMETLIGEGFFQGVLDVTTTEWADELVGGVLSAGPTRLDAAAHQHIPQVIAPGCLDMVNFWAPATIPAQFNDRRFYHWNPNVTLMRTNPAENRELGRILAEKANQSTAPVAIFWPRRGVSILDSPGNEFWWPEADEALYSALKEHLRPDIPVIEMDNNINDEAFAEAVTQQLLTFLSTE